MKLEAASDLNADYRSAPAKDEVRLRAGFPTPQGEGGSRSDVPVRGFQVRERWEGCVEDRLDTYFVAALINIDTGETLDAEIMLDDVHAADMDLVEAGALFFWNIGYESAAGRHLKVSEIKFRRVRRSESGGLSPEARAFILSSADNDAG